MPEEIPLFDIHWDEKDMEAIGSVVRRGSYWCTGPKIEKLERMICTHTGARYRVTFNSGGSALHGLMLAYKIGCGDEVIVPSFTFIATAYAPLYVGAKPVFADVEVERFGLDPEDVVERITPRTKAILPIHYGGIPCRINELKEIAEDHELLILEDAAEAFGAQVHGQNVGTVGDSGIFSFCQNKIFTTSEGAAWSPLMREYING